jgi:hypothetical protein
VRVANTLFVVEVEGDQELAELGLEFDHELLFPVNRDNAVGVSENIRSDSKFESRLRQYPHRR